MKKTIIVALLLLPVIAISAIRLRSEIRSTADLHQKSWNERQRAVYGDWYAVVQQMKSTPLDQRIDIIMMTPDAWGVAVFTATALAPRRCSIFLGDDAWQRRERVALMHDTRAANAAGTNPPVANIVLVADNNDLRVRP